MRNVKGANGVINLIRIKERVSPADVKRKIEEAPKRSAKSTPAESHA